MREMFALMGLLVGFTAALCYAGYRVDKHQYECSRHGLVYSPRLHGGLDYCVPVGK